jgi:hypothetical protein
MEVALEAMVSTKCTKAAAKLVIEGLLAHFFSTDLPQYALEDARWFFELINKQQRCWLVEDENDSEYNETNHSSQGDSHEDSEDTSLEQDGSEEDESEEEIDESRDEMEACGVSEDELEDRPEVVESEEQNSEQYKAQIQVKGDVQFNEYPLNVPYFARFCF